MKQISQISIDQQLELDFQQDLKVDFWGVLHYRGLEDHGTLLADAIKAKPAEDTQSGCGSKHHLAVGGGGRWHKKERRRGHQEAWEIGKKSLIIIVTVSYTPATRCHSQSVLALGVWWVTPCHSCHPSIFIPFISHPHTNAFSFIVIFFVVVLSAEGITVMPSSSKLSITAVPTRPVILVMAKGSGVSSCPFWSIWSNHWLKGTFLQLGWRLALKLWYASENQASWMIDAWMLTHPPREKTQSFDPQRNKI